MDYTAGLPVDGAPPSLWQSEGKKQKVDPQSSISSFPESCDVVIVGGGYAGIATAYHLLNSTSPPPTVLLLEAREACSGATGRNGGHLRPDYLLAAGSNAKRYTAAAAAEVVRFEADHLAVLKSLIESEGIECDFEETKSFAVFTTLEQAKIVQGIYDDLMQAPSFNNGLLDHVELYIGDDAPRRTGMFEAKGYFSTPSALLNPRKLFTALLLRCLKLGLSFKRNTGVTSVRECNSWQIVTTQSGETVRARKVVVGTNAYTSTVLPEYSTAIIPCKGLACHITGPEGKPLPKLSSSSFAIMEQDPITRTTGYTYMIQLADNTIVTGGAHHKYDANDLGSWYKNIDTTRPIKQVQTYFEDAYMQKSFIGWKDSQAHVDQVWTGIMGYSPDSLPHVGKVPKRDDVYVIAGFHGHGMPVIFLAAKGIAAMIIEGIDYEMTGLPSLFKTSRDRLVSERNDILAGRGIQSTME